METACKKAIVKNLNTNEDSIKVTIKERDTSKKMLSHEKSFKELATSKKVEVPKVEFSYRKKLTCQATVKLDPLSLFKLTTRIAEVQKQYNRRRHLTEGYTFGTITRNVDLFHLYKCRGRKVSRTCYRTTEYDKIISHEVTSVPGVTFLFDHQ